VSGREKEFVREKEKIRRITYDPDTLERLIREYYADIYRYCCCHVGNRMDAEDITQEVFLKFLSSLEHYAEYGKIKNYLYVIARNQILDHGKSRKILLLEAFPENMADNEATQGCDLDERLQVLDAVADLEDQERELIILRYYQDLTIKEIAVITGKAPSTVRYTLKKAEKILRSSLEV
jgi:RNA polymerase sigma factor (sigma-70 family)